MTEQKLNIHIGLCGACGGNVTHQSDATPRCEQCGAEPLLGAQLPMKALEVPGMYDPPPLVRDSKGRFRRPGEV